MTVPSFEFVGYAIICAMLLAFLGNSPLRRWVLLAFNVGFLGFFIASPVMCLPFAGFLAFGYLAFRLLQRQQRPLGAPIAIVATVLILCWLKRYSFIPNTLFIPYQYLLLGLSYVFFRVLHLIIDAAQGVLTEEIGIIGYLNYTLNFTAIVAGPIQLYPDYRESWRSVGWVDVGQASERIVSGLFKVIVASHLLDSLHKQAISTFPSHGLVMDQVLQASLIVGLYPLYLYANFSGYTDAVIGAARLMGLRMPENFNAPFNAANFIEFWARWHISLSSWLKTYVYNPFLMMLMRHVSTVALQPFLAVIAFFLTFFLVGAWHGQTSEFLFFGILQGGGVASVKLYQILGGRALGRGGFRRLGDNAAYKAICRGLTYGWFAFTMLWFWSNWTQIETLGSALGMWSSLAVALVVVAVATAMIEVLRRMVALGRAVEGASGLSFGSRYARTVLSTVLITVVVFIVFVLAQTPPDIVYKTF